jgi:hypothetical protein
MKICGLDLSMNSSGLVSFELDEQLNVVAADYLGFTTVKKVASADSKIEFYTKKDTDRYATSIWMTQKMLSFISGSSYLATEGYAYGASGNTFDIGEFCGFVKMNAYKEGIPLRVYDITSIKKFATDKGTADKISMYDAFMKTPHANMISKLPVPTKGSGVGPTSDICDSYWISELLRTELRLRKGLIRLQDLSEEKISIFNRVTKAAPENILDTPFLQKEIVPTITVQLN